MFAQAGGILKNLSTAKDMTRVDFSAVVFSFKG
jgi:hypothetical protein